MAAIGGIFVVTLIIVSIITVKVSDLILDSRIGALDRTLGFLFGAARGFLICVIGWVFLNWLLQGKNPEWAGERPHPSGRSKAPATASSPCCRTTRRAFCSSCAAAAAPEGEPAEPAEPDPQRGTAPRPPAAAGGAADGLAVHAGPRRENWHWRNRSATYIERVARTAAARLPRNRT